MSADPAVLTLIPPRVLGRVQQALQHLHAWNTTLGHARGMEAVAHQPGRYEYDLRHGVTEAPRRARVAEALTTLATFEALALTNGVDPEAVYAALGGKPALLPEGAHVHAWRPSRAS
jgi:hypothetical protein